MDGRWSVGRWSLVIGRWSMVDGHGHGHGQKCLESLSVHSLCQNSKVAVSHPLTKVRYRAARAPKNWGNISCPSFWGVLGIFGVSVVIWAF